MCAVIGAAGVEGGAFPVFIDASDWVGDLKKLIKQEIATTVDCDARDLKLWFAVINNDWLPSADLKQGLVPRLLNTLAAEEELDTTWEIGDLIQERRLPPPKSRQIHVLVKTPAQTRSLSVQTTEAPDALEHDNEVDLSSAKSSEVDAPLAASASTTTSSTRIDLMRLYGRKELVLHEYFTDVPTSRSFIQDYALNQDFHVHIVKTGSLRKMNCTGSHENEDGSETPCPWSVWLTLKRPSTMAKNAQKKPKTKLSHVPANAWYISKLVLEHIEGCSGIGDPDPGSRQITELRGFKEAAMHGFAAVIRSLKERDGIDVSHKQAMLYRLIKDFKTNAAK